MPIFLGTDGDNMLDGSNGDDQIYARGGSDTINGGGGNDIIFIEADPNGSDTIDGGDGEDAVFLETSYSDFTASYDAISGYIVFTGNDGTSESIVNVEQVGFTDTVVYIVGAGGYATIQDAVDAAGSDALILVADGVYTEQVVIDGKDNLTIEAINPGMVTIQAPADLVETGRSSSDREIHAVITVNDSENTVLRGLTVDGTGVGNTVDEGSGAGAANFYGVFYRNSSGGTDNVDITGVRDPYPGGAAAGGEPIVGGSQRGVAIVVDNDNPGAGNSLLSFFMTGGTLSDFQKNGTAFNYADLNISGVTVTGGGAQTIIAQNGFQMIGCTGDMTGNIVTGIGYAGASNFYAASFLGYSNVDLAITGNTIVGSNVDDTAAKVVGIYLLDSFGDISGGEVSGNTISHVDNAITIYGDIAPDNVLVENNTVSDLDLTDPSYAGASGVYFATIDPAITTPFDVDGTSASDYLVGAAGDDSFSGLGGDDYLQGNAGNDTLNGGDGNDIAKYSGSAADYSYTTTTTNGRVTGFTSVTDNNAGDGDEGMDTLSGIEQLQFGDSAVDISGNVQVFDENGAFVGSYDTIQEGVDASSDDYTINVAAGTYNEVVTVDVDVTILGANAGVAGSGVRGSETTVDGGFYMNAAGATLDGLTVFGGATIAGNPSAIYVNQDDVTLTNLIVQSDGSVGTGIVTTFNGDVTGLVLSDSAINGWANGTYFNPTTQFTADGNSFDGNNVALTGDDWADGTMIANNSFTNSAAGHVGYGSFDTVDNVGAYFGAGNTYDASGGRIGIFAYGDGDAGGQTITGTSQGDYIGGFEYVAGSGDDATFNGAGGDDYLDGNSGNDTLNGGIGDDVEDGGAGTDTALFADALAASDVALSGGDWAVTSGTEGTDTLKDIEIVQHSGGQILLVGNGGFDTIQEAVNAADPGDEVLIASGTYNENVTITEGISLIGFGDPVLAPPSGNAISVTGDIDAGGAAEVRVEGLTISGGQTGVRISSGTALDSLVIDNVEFDGQSLYGVGSGSGAPNVGNVSITNSTFTENGVGGPNNSGSIDLFGFTGDALIQNVIISNSSTSATPVGDRADRAIAFNGRDALSMVDDPAGNVVIENVSITGFYHKPPLNIQGYTDLSGFEFTNVTINAGSDWGYVIFIDPVADPGNFAGGASTSTLDLSGIDVTNQSTTDAGFDVFVRGTDADDITTGTNARDLLNVNAEGDVDYGGNDSLSGLGGDDILLGGIGDDTLLGGEDDDMLEGGDGDDYLEAGSGSDTLVGGSGNDYLVSGVGIDELTGGTGDDLYLIDDTGDLITEVAGEGNDGLQSYVNYTLSDAQSIESMTALGTVGLALTGNSFANNIAGNSGDDTLIGGGGADVLDGAGGANVLLGGAGDDLYLVRNTSDQVFESSGQGTDTVFAYADFTLTGNLENLRLKGSAINGTGNGLANSIQGTAAGNMLNGEGGADVIQGFGGNDTLNGGADNDFVLGGSGNDAVSGDAGNDSLKGGTGDDLVSGGTGEDKLFGNDGADNLDGGDGDDKLFGNNGDDTLLGGAGRDRLGGGSGSDTFAFDEPDLGSTRATADIVLDFDQSENDLVDVHAIDAVEGGAQDGFVYIGDSAFSKTAGELRYEIVGGKTFVEGDTDGDGAADFVIRFQDAIVFQEADFVI